MRLFVQIAVMIAVRLLVIGIIAAVPPAVAGFIEWNASMAAWSPLSRAAVGISWAVMLLGFIFVIVSVAEDRKAKGR